MKILITGRQGQLGSELHDLQQKYPQHQMVFVDREEMDLSNQTEIIDFLNIEKPESLSAPELIQQLIKPKAIRNYVML